VDILQGIRLEAAALPDKPERALGYYDELLSEDESNAVRLNYLEAPVE
jgi:hypothetical protein